MNRTVIVALLGFAAAFGAERMFAGLAKDIARYDRIRAMSDQPPLLNEVFATAAGVLGTFTRHNSVTSFLNDITNDMVRYAKMKSM